jgi:hypothetical protein
MKTPKNVLVTGRVSAGDRCFSVENAEVTLRGPEGLTRQRIVETDTTDDIGAFAIRVPREKVPERGRKRNVPFELSVRATDKTSVQGRGYEDTKAERAGLEQRFRTERLPSETVKVDLSRERWGTFKLIGFVGC